MKPIRNDRGKDLRNNRLVDFAGAIRWLRDHGIPYGDIRALFPEFTENNLGVIDFRNRRNPTTKKGRRVLEEAEKSEEAIGRLLEKTETELRPVSEGAQFSDRDYSSATVRRLEDEVEEFAGSFWKHVRFLDGARTLGDFRRRISNPASDNVVLVRTGGRVNHLLAEMHLHAGYTASALAYATKAYEWESQTYNARPTRFNLDKIGRTLLLISHTFILRQEFFEASQWLKKARKAFAQTRRIDPELFRQEAVVALHIGDLETAKKEFQLSGDLLSEYNPYSTVAAVKDARDRFLNLINEDWGKAFELMEYAAEAWPAGDIHIGINVNWAAGIGFSVDDPEGHHWAQKLLAERGSINDGYGHQATVTRLLRLTSRLPMRLWKQWVLFAFYYNACRNK
jgi:tetratricopeptide (TPR) repeat protein